MWEEARRRVLHATRQRLLTTAAEGWSGAWCVPGKTREECPQTTQSLTSERRQGPQQTDKSLQERYGGVQNESMHNKKGN